MSETVAIKCLNSKDFRDVEEVLIGKNCEWFSGRNKYPDKELDIQIFPIYIFIDNDHSLSIGDTISLKSHIDIPIISSRKIIRKKKLNKIIGKLEL